LKPRPPASPVAGRACRSCGAYDDLPRPCDESPNLGPFQGVVAGLLSRRGYAQAGRSSYQRAVLWHQPRSNHAIDPAGDRFHEFAAHLRILAAGPRWHLKRMVGIWHEFEHGSLAERLADRPDLVRQRERIARALQEQHRDRASGQMLGALARWPSGRM